MISVRSKESMVRETQVLASHYNFKAISMTLAGRLQISRTGACDLQETRDRVPTKFCLFSRTVPASKGHIMTNNAEKLRVIAAVSKVKKVFVRSGIRF